MPESKDNKAPGWHQRLGFWLGPLVAAAAYVLLPDQIADASLSGAGRWTAAIACLMAVWWLSEALPLPATALLPLALFPLTGAAAIGDAATPYANPVIFLFLGGFLLGLAMERWSLHRRIALNIVLRVGTSPQALTGGFMLATALLSMWISNTAAAIILLPVAVSILATLSQRAADSAAAEVQRFGTGLMLAIAYAASIGGVGTLIGSPPNLVLAGYASNQLGCDIGMLEWMRFGIPMVLLMLPLTWWYLTRIAYRSELPAFSGGSELIRDQLRDMGRLSPGERLVLVVFALTASAWIFRPLLAQWLGLPGLSDAGIAMAAALALFMIRVPRSGGQRLMDWDTAVRLPWGILLLFGGGLSLAAGIAANGVDRYIAAAFAGADALPMFLLLLMVGALVKLLTELTSNTAVATTFVPILAAVAIGLGVDPMPLLLVAAVGASFAFMLPVATPPNAVVFSSGYVSVGQMARTGLALNLVAVVIVASAAWLAGGTLCR